MARTTAPPRQRPVLIRSSRLDETCPSCIDRGAVNLLGRPVWYRRVNLCGGCETCGGTGRVTSYEVAGTWPPGDRFYLRGDRRAKP